MSNDWYTRFWQKISKHKSRLINVLRRLEGASMPLNAEICKFPKARVNVLGHILDAHGISADTDKTESMRSMPAPENVAELKPFLRMANRLTKCLPGITEKTQPLRELIHSGATW